MSDEINATADEYIDKFIVSDLSLIKISDNMYSRMELRHALISRINERGLGNLTVYTFMNALYLEKV